MSGTFGQHAHMPIDPSQRALLRVADVSARYGRIIVCSQISFDVAAGELLIILGPNGAGKSSLLGALAGCVTGGGAIYLGTDEISGLPTHRRASAGLAFVPEVRGNIFPALSIDENLRIGLRMTPPARRKEMIEYVIDLFPILAQRRETLAGLVSGGEQQMLAVAIAVLHRPRALLLDEPTQGLAPSVFDVLENALTALRKAAMAIVVAEQNLGFAARIADRFIVLSEGRVAMAGPGDELRHSDVILDSFFGERDAAGSSS